VDDIARMLEGRPYVWLVVRDIESADPDWTVKAWLDTHGYIRQEDLVRESISVLTYIRWDRAPQSRAPSDEETGLKSFLPLTRRGRELQVHKVRPGETLLEIAVRYGTTIQFLMEINDLKNPNELSVGQEIQVPMVTAGTPYP
jgi:LysM repeat protein